MNATAAPIPTASTPPQAAAIQSVPPQRFCTFLLAGRTFAIDAGIVSEVLRSQPLTPVPRAPGPIRGLLTLRGRIVPAFDMRLRLGFPEAPSPISPTNIVLVVGGEFFSLLVDALVDVIDIPLASIEPPVAGAEQAGLDCLEGVHAAGDGLVHLLRAEAIIGGLTAPDLERKKR